MKIGIDCRLWNETGVGRYTRNLVLELSRIDTKNNYILFVLSKDVSSIKYQVLSKNWKIVVADINWHTIKEQIKFPSILNIENLDLVHFPYISIPLNYKKPFVITIHDLIPYHYPTSKASALPAPFYFLKLQAYKYIIKQASKKAQKIIVPSDFTRHELVKHLMVDENKIAVTHEGFDTNIKDKNNKKNSEYDKYFLYVGNAFPHKNLDRLVESFKLLEGDIKLILVGKEDYFYKKLKNKVNDLKISEKIIFLNNIEDEELASLYKNAIALINPSLMEGFGLPVLEAMANKCLILASDIPTHKEICQDAAIYFDPKNIKDIESKLNSIRYNDIYHYSDKINRGLERAKLFSFEKMAIETLKVYEGCVGL